MDLTAANAKIAEFSRLIEEKTFNPYSGELKVGVDLGTANIVLSVVDQEGNPVAGATYGASVVKDGLVVDYVGAVRIVKDLKEQVEQILEVRLTEAATAIPPGTLGGNVKGIINVVESADMNVTHVVDEPTAAAIFLGIQEGAVVDVGGGTTGVSILKEGKVIYTADEPTGGTHMSLVLAGFYKTTFEEAERLKKRTEDHRNVFTIIKPVVEKMATIVKNHIAGYSVDKIYVVGGACCFDEFESVFAKEIGIETIKPHKPLLVTPLGIAMHSTR
ncbi:ethanolamine utilization protein EutJ [Geosporobacter subterraneus DSM 17957]|uniref:Chaperone protein DnaK n=1 Tax=Geosporobacter subterraneus DSM 17957 TaxID=1121919 RepID=A0A1M6LPY7_9FIRM|nr:ethanolamine utilization protein EutJ [Geosporobacter subterraneus]SHJ73132.1 ethanolamine utilization protein EutJ [Geosporobacter subterraneus DSM 17957]